MTIRDFSSLDDAVVRALTKGPLYRPTLELILGINETQARRSLKNLIAQGKVELAIDIGPATYRLTNSKED